MTVDLSKEELRLILSVIRIREKDLTNSIRQLKSSPGLTSEYLIQKEYKAKEDLLQKLGMVEYKLSVFSKD